MANRVVSSNDRKEAPKKRRGYISVIYGEIISMKSLRRVAGNVASSFIPNQ